ncbi:MAG: hypothetical protein ACXACR_14340 [Candidatus Hodarchaeales archaeon]
MKQEHFLPVNNIGSDYWHSGRISKIQWIEILGIENRLRKEFLLL